MDFDYKNKHNLKFHQDSLRQRKSIRNNVVGAQKNSFEAAAAYGKSSKLSKTGVCTEVPIPTRLYKMMRFPRKVRQHFLTKYIVKNGISNLYILLKIAIKMQEMPF